MGRPASPAEKVWARPRISARQPMPARWASPRAKTGQPAALPPFPTARTPHPTTKPQHDSSSHLCATHTEAERRFSTTTRSRRRLSPPPRQTPITFSPCLSTFETLTPPTLPLTSTLLPILKPSSLLHHHPLSPPIVSTPTDSDHLLSPPQYFPNPNSPDASSYLDSTLLPSYTEAVVAFPPPPTLAADCIHPGRLRSPSLPAAVLSKP
ncbi:proline-rich receptor-like protein kinase PERK10 [Vigna unguiculata]|uniref:proline-rich receptor-like protein kinase PERK10 n=1 Tax=Vigna unguiculata TaxID=3917 RepID=UPI0010170287|nr:proline-rich receptor-like protein kinase PERK10 [Vigna unguiculata]